MSQARRAIASIAHFRLDGQALPVLLIVVMAALGVAHILVRTSAYGSAVQYDSVLFLSIAESLAAGEGLRTFEGGEFVIGAPFFPTLLAAISLAGIHPEEAGRLVNAVAFGLVVLASGLWLWRTLSSSLLALLGTIIVLVSYPLNDRFAQIMTEPLFILFTILSLLFLESFLNRKASAWILLVAAGFAALAAVTRYAGITVIGTGVFLLLFRRNESATVGLKHAAIFGAVASIPLVAVLLRNRISAGTFVGNTGDLASGQSVNDALQSMINVFDTWIVPENMNQSIEWIVYTGAGILVVLALSGTIFSQKIRAHSRDAVHTISPYLGFTAIYLIFITIITPFVSPQNIDERYIVPIWIPVTLAALFFFDRFISLRLNAKVRFARMLGTTLILSYAIVHVFFTVQMNLSSTSSALNTGYTDRLYNTKYWNNSQTIYYLSSTQFDENVYYSPASALLWYRSGTPAIEWKYRWIPQELDELVDLIPRGIVHVVLIDGDHTIRAEYADTFRFLPGVEVVAEFSDGGVYRFPRGWRFDMAGYRANVNRYLSELTEESGELVGSGDFDVYVSGRTLLYVREPCALADTAGWFFLHVDPDDPADLPDERQQYGFDNLDFVFDRQATRFDEKCLTTVNLPNYDIARIRTGQYDNANLLQLWSVEFTLPER